MDRKEWDKLEIGDTVHTRAGDFVVRDVDSYYRCAVDQAAGRKTVISVTNYHGQTMRWGHYLLNG